jgi:hypothetical protein
MTSYTASCFVSASGCSVSEEDTRGAGVAGSSPLRSLDLLGTRPYRTAVTDRSHRNYHLLCHKIHCIYLQSTSRRDSNSRMQSVRLLHDAERAVAPGTLRQPSLERLCMHASRPGQHFVGPRMLSAVRHVLVVKQVSKGKGITGIVNTET